MSVVWRIELLGWLRAVNGNCTVSHFRTHKTGVLLAYLAYYRHRSHPREHLIELLWPAGSTTGGRVSLSTALSSLRSELEAPAGRRTLPPPNLPEHPSLSGAVILADRAAVQLNSALVTTDVAEFSTALQAAAQARVARERIQRLAEAVDLYRGELLPGCSERWIRLERERLAEAFFQALKQLAALLEQSGDLARATHYAWRAVLADPQRKDAFCELNRLLAAAGKPTMIRHYPAR